MDIAEMFQNKEQKFIFENLERLQNASQSATEEEISRIIRDSDEISQDSYYSHPTEILLISLYSVLAVMGFVLNMFMTCVILFSKKLMRNPSNLLVLNLMTSDLLMVIFCVPFTLLSLIWKTWMFGEAMCKLIPFLQSVFIIVSSATIAMIAIDRLIRVTKNISTNSYHSLFARTHWIMISVETACIWIFAIVISSPIAFFQQLITMSVRTTIIFSKCMEIWPQGSYKGMYAVTNMMIQFLLPTLILIYSNVMIKRHLEKNLSGLDQTSASPKDLRVTINLQNASDSSTENHNTSALPSLSSFSFGRILACGSQDDRIREHVQSGALNKPHSSDSINLSNESMRRSTNSAGRSDTISRNRSLLMNEIRRNRQVTRTLFSIVLCFTITWLPWNLYNVYLDFNNSASQEVRTTYLILAFCYLIAMTTIPVNAFMYGWANPAIRAEALTLLGLVKRTIAAPETRSTRQRGSARITDMKSDPSVFPGMRPPIRSSSA